MNHYSRRYHEQELCQGHFLQGDSSLVTLSSLLTFVICTDGLTSPPKNKTHENVYPRIRPLPRTHARTRTHARKHAHARTHAHASQGLIIGILRNTRNFCVCKLACLLLLDIGINYASILKTYTRSQNRCDTLNFRNM